jgi:hypothetical protein
MNVKKGTRRLGIVLGLCGAILGGYLARSYARAVWHNYRASSRFESLRASPTIQKVAKAIQENRNDPSRSTPGSTIDSINIVASWNIKRT